MKKIIIISFFLITCILFLTSFASASTMQYIRFSDFEYMDFINSEADYIEADYIINTENAEEIQNLIEENNIYVWEDSEVIRIERYFVKTRETKINLTEKVYLKNITNQGRGYFKNEYIECSSFNLGELTMFQDRTVDPYLRNTSSIFKPMILKDVISYTDKSLDISTEYTYNSPEHYTEIMAWDMYTCITFETYNVFKNEWETGELYIPEGSVFMALEYNSDQGRH